MIKGLFSSLVSGAFARAGSAIFTILSIPMMMSYFGTEEYGSFVIVTSIVSFFQIAGLSVNGIVAIIGPQLGTKISVSFLIRKLLKFFAPYFLIIMACCTLFAKPLLSTIVESFYKGKIPVERFSLVLTFSICTVVLSLIVQLYQSAFCSIHKIYISNIYQFINATLAFLTLWVVGKMNLGIVFYSAFLLISNALQVVILSVHFYVFNNDETEKVLACDDIRTSNKNIYVTSLMLTFAAVISTVTGQVDSLIIPHFLSNKDLVSFSIAFRVITYEMLVYHILFAAIMPSIGKWFFSKNEWGNICATYRSVFRCSLSIGLSVGYFNVTYLRDILHLWIGERVAIGQSSIFILSLYFVMFGLHSANYAVYSCFNVKRKTQIAVSFIEPAVKVVISYFLIKGYGVAGATYSILLLAALVTFPLTTAMLYFLSDRRVMLWENLNITSLAGTFLAVVLLGVVSGSTPLIKHVAGTVFVMVFLLNAIHVIKCGLASHVRIKDAE